MEDVMKNLKVMSLGVVLVTLSSCGIGKKMVKDLKFVTEKQDKVFYTGFDAKIDLGGISLPPATLPIHQPKNPKNTIGYFKIDDSGLVSIRVDLEKAAKVSVLDGRLLPNGRDIPIALPDGVVPIAFPVGGSKSLVYLAFGSSSLMAGTSISLKPNIGGTVGDLLKTQMNLFFPFNIDATLKGSVGVYSGSSFGLGVFAVKDLSKAEKSIVSSATGIVHTMSAESAGESFEPKTQMPSKGKALKFYEALRQIEHLELN
jgi:hypothetical protein